MISGVFTFISAGIPLSLRPCDVTRTERWGMLGMFWGVGEDKNSSSSITALTRSAHPLSLHSVDNYM